MNNNNSFIKECIANALVDLMSTKEFKDITITEITKKAGVSRMSYYRNYFKKEDILNNYMTEILEKYGNQRQYIIDNNKDSMYPLILHAFNFFKKHENFVITLEKSNLSNIIQNKINDYIFNFYPEEHNETSSKYNLYILSGALYNTCKIWLINGCKETSEELAKIFVDRLFK
ncbi:MAG: TetR/AcrR family transcriptional regulator [Tenericutes bacterium]|nr:TetR/AcrR family transcriptional regulator [Mycoplasmatota bacterium]